MSALTEEEQLNNLKSATKKYASPVIGGIVIALVGFFGWNYWQGNSSVNSQNETVRVQQLMDQMHNAVTDKNSLANTTVLADTIVTKAPDSVHAIQSQLIMAKINAERGDYAAVEADLQKVQSSKIKDEGLLALVNIHLANAQSAQKKYDDALQTLDLVQLESFKATVMEARGDIYTVQNQLDKARQAYQDAWNAAIVRKQERPTLQIKLENAGVLVNDPDIERPIWKTQGEDS